MLLIVKRPVNRWPQPNDWIARSVLRKSHHSIPRSVCLLCCCVPVVPVASAALTDVQIDSYTATTTCKTKPANANRPPGGMIKIEPQKGVHVCCYGCFFPPCPPQFGTGYRTEPTVHGDRTPVPCETGIGERTEPWGRKLHRYAVMRSTCSTLCGGNAVVD